MAKESEKRFNAVMDKLFYAPKTPKSARKLGVEASRGQKRPNMAAAFSKVELKSRGSIAEQSQNSLESAGALQAPLCRPWDRGDLQRRLATFKSMTWFAKPQVVSAVNCALRGWINVDSDIIACESCGSLEKAANVFSLKLDNGHKIFCPWVDNACDEALAQFPPTTSTMLVDDYKKRYAALFQLSALPVISLSAIDLMKSPQLDDFLKESSTIKFINMSADASSLECLVNESQNVSSPYYQALRLVSLCGWEFRLVPYFVDYEIRENSSVKDVNLSKPSSVVSIEENPSVEGISEPNEDLSFANDSVASNKQYDPSSVVLGCQLCGASVGLWAFSTTPRPVEYVRLVGEVNGEIGDAYHKRDTVIDNDLVTNQTLATANASDISKTGTRSLVEIPSSLNLTIAGGPSPAKQNFVPTISLPVIGRNLRARFSSEFESRPGDGQSNGTDNECLGPETNEQCYTLQSENDDDMLVEAPVTDEQIIVETDRLESMIKNQPDNSLTINQATGELLMLEDAAVIKSSSCEEVLRPSELRDSGVSTSGGNISSADVETSMSDSLMMVACAQRAPSSEMVCSKHGYSQEGHGNKATMQEVNSMTNKGLDMKQSPLPKKMEFDPIRQHRHFCPWITSTGSSLPGWKQTLCALQRQKEFSSPSSARSLSSSLIEVDDPVASIKKLFMSPSSKRAKLADN
ncbi:hypothetical protein DCAR_0312826 [Daucus carota subsp. sativus]|uniref:C3HC-type domain-containing protein n=1 Tax=Daucus carota subsp. sativus TaxID=79200 RepID=A0AAF1AVB6_DAUCS|nr:hypothetical protein DCAR_0312826 [Daucus carota subsp. sativus]